MLLSYAQHIHIFSQTKLIIISTNRNTFSMCSNRLTHKQKTKKMRILCVFNVCVLINILPACSPARLLIPCSTAVNFWCRLDPKGGQKVSAHGTGSGAFRGKSWAQRKVCLLSRLNTNCILLKLNNLRNCLFIICIVKNYKKSLSRGNRQFSTVY